MDIQKLTWPQLNHHSKGLGRQGVRIEAESPPEILLFLGIRGWTSVELEPWFMTMGSVFEPQSVTVRNYACF